MVRKRLFGFERHRSSSPPGEDQIDFGPGPIGPIFSVPQWLHDVGIMAWLLVGVGLLLAGLIWIMGLTQVIVGPVLTAAVVASVASPLVRKLNALRVPRGLGAALVMLSVIAIGAGVVVMIVNGITGVSAEITPRLDSAQDTIAGWLQDLGLDADKAEAAKSAASSGIGDSASALLGGLTTGVAKLSSLAFFLAMTVLSLFFLLKDGPVIRQWTERHMGIPLPVARTISRRVLQSLRGYFLGVTIVAAFNAAIVTLGCLVLGVPLIGTIAAVTFIGGFIPYIGAWSAAGFAVLIALGAQGPEAAGGLIVVELLANGAFQQLVQPFAMGAALGIHPLVVLVVTIAAGALFGAIGLILAAPLVSAAVRISADLGAAHAAEATAQPA